MPLAITMGKVVAFVALMLIVGRRVIPWILHTVAHTGSRELFRLAVLAIALGVAFAAATLFGVSFALGAFFAGMVMSESELSQRAANETLPLRDAFAVLFFVSVGMLFDPMILVNDFLPVLAAVLIIVVGKSIAAFAIVRAFRHDTPTALTISASLAQIGEFSFILAGLGVSLELLPERGRNLILAGAIVSILLNPLIFAVLDRYLAKQAAAAAPDKPQPTAAREPVPPTTLSGHTVLVGHGRVGGYITAAATSGPPFLVIEDNVDIIQALNEQGRAAIQGNAADPEVLAAANIAGARCMLVAIPDAFEGGQVIQQARALNAALPIIARAHSEAEIEHLMKHGASTVVMGEHEIAKAMLGFIPGAETKPATA
jgi:CPA2 family monovalent cation:H+ antiporter-2